jgi:hypothetical protein
MHAFPQDSVRKVKTFHGFYHGKPTFTRNNWRLHAFPRIISRKGMPFRGIIYGKFWLSENYTPWRHAFPRYNPRKVKFRARITPRNSRKNIKLLFNIHQGPIRCCLMQKKRDQKISCYSPFK